MCELCHGKGHGKPQCTSKGGGKWTDPALNQKGKGAGSWNQQTSKGKGKYGAKGFGKGKGQGKFNSFDDGFAPPGFEPAVAATVATPVAARGSSSAPVPVDGRRSA